MVAKIHRMDHNRIPRQPLKMVSRKWKETAWKTKEVLERHTVRRSVAEHRDDMGRLRRERR